MCSQRLFILSNSVCRRVATIAALTFFICLSNASQSATAAEFIPLGTLPGFENSLAYGISDDGLVVAGYVGHGSPEQQAYRWTDATGMVGLGYLRGYDRSTAGSAGYVPLSNDGSTIVGRSYSSDSNVASSGFVHTVADGMSDLGGDNSGAIGVSQDGQAVIGDIGFSSFDLREAFRWTPQDGLIGLGVLPGSTGSNAEAISRDGSVVVGRSTSSRPDPGSPFEKDIFIWTEEQGMTRVAELSDVFTSSAMWVSNDGATIATTTKIDDVLQASYWSSETGIVGLGRLPGSEVSRFRDMTPDGRVIVGWSGPLRGAEDQHAFVWTEDRGMEDFQQVLNDSYGLREPLADWDLIAIESLSANGQYFTGIGVNPLGAREAWVVRLDAPWGAPVPEPTSVVLILVAFAPLTMLRRNR